jgi:chromate transporter
VSTLPGATDDDHPRPHSLAELFLAFTLLALQGFGGVLAVVQREIVDRRRWLTQSEFIEDWAVAQIMPGPNVVNLSLMIGGRYFGVRGALAALGGLLTAPLVIVLLLALAQARLAADPAVQAATAGALRGMGAVCAGLIGATALRLGASLRRHPLGPAACVAIAAAGFVLVALLHAPLFLVLATLGGVSCVLTWRCLPHDPARP